MKRIIDTISSGHLKRIKRFSDMLLLRSNPSLIIISISIITMALAFFLPSLKFNYNMESFFASGDQETAFYHQHRELFGNENDFLLLGIEHAPTVFQMPFLIRLDSLGKRLKKIKGIESVYSPTNLYETIMGPFGNMRIPLIHITEPEKYDSDKKRIFASDVYNSSFFSPDGRAVSLLIQKAGDLSRAENERLLEDVQSAAIAFSFNSYHLAGRIQTKHHYIWQMKQQMKLFAVLGFLLFIVSLYLIFRNVQYVLLALLSVGIAQVWIFGIIGWTGIPIDMMLSLLPALVFIISTSGSIHLLTRFRNEYREKRFKTTAIRKAVHATGLPNFLNAFTTSIGFASLVMIPVVPIQRFGLFTSLGILLSFIVSLILLPVALRIIHIKPIVSVSDNNLVKNRFLSLIVNRPAWVVAGFSIIILAGVFFSFQTKVNNHFLDDLTPSSKLKADLDFFEQNFSGIRPFEMEVRVKKGEQLLSLASLKELELLENHLKNEYGVGFLFSPLTIIKNINKATHGGRQSAYILPHTTDELNTLLRMAERQHLWRHFLPLINSDQSIARITGRTKDEGSRSFAMKNKELASFLQANTHILDVRITGAAHLMDNANRHIARDLSKGMLLAILMSTLLIGLFTKSWKMAVISLIPNLIPLLLITGFMGMAGIPLKVATALIFTISYGIGVDDTIHFLNSYRLNKQIFPDASEAIRHTVSKMWRPMLYTSVVLFSGFMIFSLSVFPSVSLLGMLVSGSLIAALLADLLLMPVLIRTSEKKYGLIIRTYK